MEDLNIVVRERLEKAAELERRNIALYPNGYPVPDKIKDLLARAGGKTAEELESDQTAYTIAGRVLSVRSFGKSTFMHIADADAKIQIYVQQNQIGKESYSLAKKLDIGDIIRVCGPLFRTKTDEVDASGKRTRAAYQRTCGRCPKNIMASKTSSFATGSATST